MNVQAKERNRQKSAKYEDILYCRNAPILVLPHLLSLTVHKLMETAGYNFLNHNCSKVNLSNSAKLIETVM